VDPEILFIAYSLTTINIVIHECLCCLQ